MRLILILQEVFITLWALVLRVTALRMESGKYLHLLAPQVVPKERPSLCWFLTKVWFMMVCLQARFVPQGVHQKENLPDREELAAHRGMIGAVYFLSLVNDRDLICQEVIVKEPV
jgi:hypothetical protein